MTLNTLNINSIVKIKAMKNSHNSISRLGELGIIPGAIVKVVKKNPFNGPIQLKLNNNHIAIRSEDAELIYVSNL
tara:strand:- start:338 stop:562 length:225 start_codon:yes stop_codon:yes gene_type:complete